MRRLNENYLRDLIREERTKKLKRSLSLSSLLFEQGSEDAGEKPAAEGGGGDKIDTPWITPEEEKKLKAQGPNKVAGEGVNGSPANDVNMLETDPGELYKIALELLKYGRSATAPRVVMDDYGFKAWKGEADGAAWLKSIGGPEALKTRIATINSGKGALVPRAEMPVLKSKIDVDVVDPTTGKSVASGKQDQVAAKLIQMGAIDLEAPYAAAEAPKKKDEPAEANESRTRRIKENYRRTLRSIKESKLTSTFIISEFCRINGYVLQEEGDPFPTNLTKADKDTYLTKGFRDESGADDDDKKSLPVNFNASSAVSALKPSQADVYLSKALGFAFGKKYQGDPVIIAGDKILDGHHRWAAANLAEPTFTMKGIQVGDPSNLDKSLKALRSIGNAMGNEQLGTEKPKKESVSANDAVMMERWQRLAGILKD